MNEIVVIFEGSGRRTERAFPTIADTVSHLVAQGYTRVSGAPHYTPSVITRLYRESGSGRYARVNTTSTPRCWPVVVDQVAELAEVLERADREERSQADAERAFWADLAPSGDEAAPGGGT